MMWGIYKTSKPCRQSIRLVLHTQCHLDCLHDMTAIHLPYSVALGFHCDNISRIQVSVNVSTPKTMKTKQAVQDDGKFGVTQMTSCSRDCWHKLVRPN